MATQAKHEELLAAMKGKAEDAGVKRQAQLLSVKEKGEQAKHKRALEQAKLAAKKQAQPPKKKGDKK